MLDEQTIRIRPAAADDYSFAWHLYSSTIRDLTDALMGWNELKQRESFLAEWRLEEVRIIVLDGADIGWFQTAAIDDTIFVKQLYVDPQSQGRGIGTHVLQTVIGEASSKGMSVALAVMKNNPAQRLYRRLGFQTKHADNFKLYMERPLKT